VKKFLDYQGVARMLEGLWARVLGLFPAYSITTLYPAEGGLLVTLCRSLDPGDTIVVRAGPANQPLPAVVSGANPYTITVDLPAQYSVAVEGGESNA